MKDALMLLYLASLIFNLMSPKYVQVNEILPLEHTLYNAVKIANASGEMRCSVQLPVSLISFHKSLLLVCSVVSETETVTHSFIVDVIQNLL